MKVILSLVAMVVATLAVAQTFTVPAPVCTAVISCQPQTVTVPSVGTTSSGSAAPAPSGVSWMYLNGVKTLAGDFTQNGTSVNYQHATTSGYNGGKVDILFSSTAPWGLFLPYWSASYSLPNPGWTYFLVSIKPTINGDTFGIHAEKVGDIDPNCHIELVTSSGNSYGPAAVAGKWGSYKVPLKDLCISGDSALYKIAVATHTGSADSWEMDAIGFQ